MSTLSIMVLLIRCRLQNKITLTKAKLLYSSRVRVVHLDEVVIFRILVAQSSGQLPSTSIMDYAFPCSFKEISQHSLFCRGNSHVLGNFPIGTYIP